MRPSEAVPRRIRAVLAGTTVVDTTRARYVWEWDRYPRYYVPLADVAAGVLVDEGVSEPGPWATTRRHGLRVPGADRPGAALVLGADATDGLAGTVRLEWSAVDAWFEEDEQVHVHPRDPYTRVDALRSTREVRVELDGVVLAVSGAPVMVFETRLPTRYYLDRTAVRWEHLRPSATVTACPYKGRTTGWWSVAVGGAVHPDLAWSYDFPLPALAAVAGLVAFYNEKVDIVVDGERLARPVTHFS